MRACRRADIPESFAIEILRSVDMTTRNGQTPDEPTIAEFKTSLRGTLIRPGDKGYDAARKIHNAMIDRRPDFIVRCAGVADAISAVNFARAHNVLVAIRGTGHNVAGTSLCDGGLVIDLYRSLRHEIRNAKDTLASVGSLASSRRRRRSCISKPARPKPLDDAGKSRDHRGIIRRDRRATTQDAFEPRRGGERRKR
jgi:hypothetical protein